ncbi:MAG: shikimate dehydrogenase [Xanthomonadales bacterium]|nr:shikimate dehydrogenase [Xanthomonadales bacterium]
MSKTFKLALFGNPVSHSLSPKIHQNFAEQFDLKIQYDLIQVESENLHQTVIDFSKNGGHGANVTLPHKQQVIDSIENISETAKQAHAVNTLYLDVEGQICGENTDGIGFINDLSNRCHIDCNGKNILILGAGGAAQGIVPEIMKNKPKSLVITNRSIEKAEKIAVSNNSKAMTFEQLKDFNQSFDLIIHASSLGHKGQTLKFKQQHIHSKTQGYDLSYGKAAQPFLDFCDSMKIQSYDGIGMLIEQAAAAFEIWFGVKPETHTIFQKLEK